MISSGEAPITTDGDTPVMAIAGGVPFGQVDIINEGSAPGFYSIDGGSIWCRMPAAAPLCIRAWTGAGLGSGAIMVKRVAGGSDLVGVYVSAVN